MHGVVRNLERAKYGTNKTRGISNNVTGAALPDIGQTTMTNLTSSQLGLSRIRWVRPKDLTNGKASLNLPTCGQA